MIVAVVVSVGLVAGATLFGHGAHGALACGSAAGIAAGIGAVLISIGIRSLQEGGWVHALAGVAVWGAIVVAVIAILGGQQAYARGSLAWSLPALILLDPLAAVPAARLLLGERLEPGHAVIWVPAADRGGHRRRRAGPHRRAPSTEGRISPGRRGRRRRNRRPAARAASEPRRAGGAAAS